MSGRILCVAILCCFLSCTPVSSDIDLMFYSLPNMNDMTCYSAIENEKVMSCTEGDILPQDPNLLNTLYEVTLSFFPMLEIDDNVRLVVIYQPVTEYESRLYNRFPVFKEAEENGKTFYVHAHTYFDKDEQAIVIECPTPMGVQTIVHELLHHVSEQLAENDILDHMIIDRMANLIIESPRMKKALRDNH